jgi:ligand-binding SRPBCC domain-containing protein
MVSQFTLVTRTGVPVEQLFDLSLSIDEHMASMGQSAERAIAGVTSGLIGLGETVTWRARHFGIWFTMTSRITSLERPTRFVDEQVGGPFRSFHHEHVFTQEGETTVMVDTVSIASPIFGRLAERVVLIPYLRRLIRRRNHHLMDTLGGAPGTDPGVARALPAPSYRSGRRPSPLPPRTPLTSFAGRGSSRYKAEGD